MERRVVAAIWQRDAAGWRLLAPVGFPDEQQLHTLVEEAPQLLPLAGAPRLVVVGREVLLGGNYADLLGSSLPAASPLSK